MKLNKKLTKRVLAWLLVLAMCFSYFGSDLGMLTAYASSVEEDPTETAAPTETEAPTETAAPAETEAPTETAAPAETEAPTETEAPAETAAPAETEAPTEPETPAETKAPEVPEMPAPEATEAPELSTEPIAPKETPQPTPEPDPDPAPTPLPRPTPDAPGAQSDAVTGQYVQITYEDGHGNPPKPRQLDLSSLTAPEGTELLEAWSFGNGHNYDYAVVTVIALPTLAEDESLSLYPIISGELSAWPIMGFLSLNDSVHFSLDAYDGFALVKVLGESPQLEEQIIDGLQPEAGVSMSLEGLLPVDAAVEISEPAAPEMLAESVQSFGSAFLSYDFTILDAEGRDFEPDTPIAVTVRSADIADMLAAGLDIVVLHTPDYVLPTDPAQLAAFRVPDPEPVRILSVSGDTVVFEAVGFSTYTIASSNAKTLDSAIYVADDFYLTGKLPGGAIVDYEPVTVDIDGERLVMAYDIKIYANQKQKDKGKTWQPAPSKVQVHFFSESFGEEEINVFHLKDLRAEPSLVTTVTADDDWISFDANSFSVYVASCTIEKTITTPDGYTYKITLTYDLDSGIPAGAELEVREVEDLSKLTEAAAAVGGDLSALSYARLLDISIVKDGVTYQPNDTVTVSVELLDADSVGDVQVVHFGAEATELAASTQGKTVTFETDGFSVFSFLDFSLLDKIVSAILGETEGVLYENDDIVLTGRMPASAIVEANRVDLDYEEVLVAYDIKIYASSLMKLLGIAWQPSEGAIQVKVKSDALNVNTVDVYHTADSAAAPELVSEELSVEDHSVTFDAASFSAYIIIDHEGSTAITTPRVQFHFIDEQYTEQGGVYTAEPYNFYNKANPRELQCSQILTDGETLEMISNPPNLVFYTYELTADVAIDTSKTYYTYDSSTDTYTEVTNPDVSEIGTYYERTTSEKYFFGWYVVDRYDTVDGNNDPVIGDTTEYDGARWVGQIKYTWTADPDKIEMELPMTLSPTTGLHVGETLSWTINGVTGSGELDDEGMAHVYLAPIYEDYYFVNFRMGALNQGNTGLQNSLLTRKLAILGSDNSVTVRIGDVICPSTDPTHLVFIGWQTRAMAQLANLADQYYATVDENGREVNSAGHTNGYYITLSRGDFNSNKVYDLYPLFSEARWLYFSTGKSGNGSTYVPASYRLNHDEGNGTYYTNAFFNSNTSARLGYTMDSWYVFANMNGNSEITNINSAENVDVSYMDAENNVHTVTFNMTALKLVESSNNGYRLVKPADNAEIASTTVEGVTYTLSASGGIVYLKIGSAAPQKLFGVLTVNGEDRLYFYRLMDDMTLYANWQLNDRTTFKVVIWKQKITDDKNAATAEKTYDYEIHYTSASVSSTAALDPTSFTDSSNTTRNLTVLSFTGFHYVRNDMAGKIPASDGSSVYNVYYDRDLMTMNFYVYGTQSYTHTTADTPTTQYALIDGEYVTLTRDNGTAVTAWTPQYTYTETPTDGTNLYGLIGGEYVGPLTRVTNTRTEYFLTQTNGGTTEYTGTVYSDLNYTVETNPTYPNTYYRYSYGYAYQLYWNTRTVTYYTYIWNGEPYIGTRYTRASGGDYYEGTRYTLSGTTYTATDSEDGTQYGVDENGGHVQLSKGTRTVYKWYAPEYDWAYTSTSATNGELYGKIGDKYYRLTPVTTSSTYVLTNTLTAGQDYLIVSGNIAGSHYALGHSGTNVAADEVTVNAGSPVYINDSDVDGTSVWTVANGYTFKNGSYYLTSGSPGNRYLAIATSSTNWAWNGTNNRLYYDGQTDRYIQYNNGFSLTNTASRVYLYQKTATLDHFTYIDDNGDEQVYSLSQTRYTRAMEPTGETVEFTGERYEQTTNDSNAWRLFYQFTGLYGQTLAYNDYVWPSERDWYANGGNNGSTSGTHTTFLDTFLETENLYGKTAATGTYSIRHYKQNLDGTWSEPPANATPSDGSGTFNFTKKYDGFTMPTWYYTGSGEPDFSNVSTAGGWTQRGSETQVSQAGNLYILYSRESNTFTFEVNYPEGAGITYGGVTVAEGATRSSDHVETVLYEAPLNGYGSSTENGVTTWYYGIDDDDNDYSAYELIAPDHYIFGGWYEDATCTVPFDFDSTMPAANKIVYAKWEPEWFIIHVDPNGAEIDHVNHGGTPYFVRSATYKLDPTTGQPVLDANDQQIIERPGDSGYNPSQSTYFWLAYNGRVEPYSVTRSYVPISDAAATTYRGNIYYYMNHQYSADLDGEWGYNANARNALYLTEDELDDYYNYYAYYVNLAGSTPLALDTWRQLYTSYGKQKYRALTGTEHYEFLGWYQVFNPGTENEYLGSMPYVFSDPVTSDVYLRAVWRLDGGYKIEYHADYYMDDGIYINGTMEFWEDPKVGSDTLSYTDGAATNIYKQPTGIEANGEPTEEYIFRGFRLVSVSEDVNGHEVYTPLEVDQQGQVTRYYQPGDEYTVLAANADALGKIHLQAVYEEKDSSYRRPYVTNLTLDANGGYLTDGTGYMSGTWHEGSKLMQDPNDLQDSYNRDITAESGWTGIGTVAETTWYRDSGGTPHLVDIIEFGDIQSNEAVHLYRYATELTSVGGLGTTSLNPPGVNYFTHPQNHFLLGFDDAANEGDYIATYPADSVISIDRNQNQTIYAVWEPMIYLNFVNDTGATVRFGLSPDPLDTNSALTLYILNEVTGLYDRVEVVDPGNITLEAGKTMHLALPYAEQKTVVVSGVNELGVGKVLTWDSSLTVNENGTDVIYDTALGDDPITYTHTYNNASCEHVLAKGQRDSSGDGRFSFMEKLLFNPGGITVTFDDYSTDYALVLKDNYDGQGNGGDTQERDYTVEQVDTNHESDVLPSTSTRMGYQLLGWAYDPAARVPNFSSTSPVGNPWTIADLNEFFNNNANAPTGGWPTADNNHTVVATLYAVWGVNDAASTVYIYKNVPDPGNRNVPFEFTLNISANYTNQNNKITGSKTFQLWHGDYAILRSTNSTSGAWIRTEIAIYKADGTDRVTNYQATGDTSLVPYKVYYTKDPVTNAYIPVGSPDASALSTYYEAVNVLMIRPTISLSTGSWSNVNISVNETHVEYYDTSITCTAQNTTRKLYVGEHANGETAAALDTPVTGATAHWDDTNAGGTLVFTNQRPTYKVALTKVLHANTSSSRIFPVTATYTLDGETVTVVGQISSGTTDSDWLSVPAGAELMLIEGNNGDYDTWYQIDRGNLTQASSVMETDPQTNETVQIGSRVPAGTSTILMDQDRTVLIDNTLKSYPITFRLYNQYNTPLSGMFSVTGPFGSLGAQLYANPDNDGIFYQNTMYVGTYTVNQSIVPSGYIGLDSAVNVRVTGSGVETDSDMVVVSEDQATGGYIVTVYNIIPSVQVELTKILDDPLLDQRTFTFRLEWTYVLANPNNPSGPPLTTIHRSNSYPIQATHAGTSETVKVPGGAVVTAEEVLTDALRAIYDTTVHEPGGTPVGSESWTADPIGNNDRTVIFTNTRKTVDVTVTKVVSGAGDMGDDYGFTATLLKPTGGSTGGGSPLSQQWDLGNGYYTDETGRVFYESDPQNAPGAYTATHTDPSFTLRHGGSVVLEIPSGAVLNLTENAGFGPDTTVTVGSGSAQTSNSITLLAADTVTDLTVTFTNYTVSVAPTGLSFFNTRGPFLYVLLLGSALAILEATNRRRRRREESDGDGACRRLRLIKPPGHPPDDTATGPPGAERSGAPPDNANAPPGGPPNTGGLPPNLAFTPGMTLAITRSLILGASPIGVSAIGVPAALASPARGAARCVHWTEGTRSGSLKEIFARIRKRLIHQTVLSRTRRGDPSRVFRGASPTRGSGPGPAVFRIPPRVRGSP